ncbi:MAG TPA: TIGR03545 family protein [Gemmatimonadaceae bacterium]|nr:TIGR03545 family protein [Gemmatimonadaceae bacterium]
MKYIRWKALLPLSVVLGLLSLGFLVFADGAIRDGVESAGTELVGAKVDLREADLDISDGSIALRGLAVTDPSSPMKNMFEAQEIQVDLRVMPLLEKKVLLDTVAVRGLRFGTARVTSGAIAKPSEASTEARSIVSQWKSQVKVPALSLSTLTQAVNVSAIAADSLATLREARHAVAFTDTARTKLVADLNALDPRPAIDSAQALATRLRGANLRTLGLTGVRTAVTDLRRTIANLNQLDDRLKKFDSTTRATAGGLTQRLAAIPAARTQDYAYARSLLKLPSLDVPSLGPQLFSDVISSKVGELMYWVQMAEKYVPPGIKRQLSAGPKRARMAGTNVHFARNATYPDFLMRVAELSMAIGGEGAAAGEYVARLNGVTTQPAVYGAPTTFALARSEGRSGPSDVRVGGMLDHRAEPVRDSVAAQMTGLTLPTMNLAGLGATLSLGNGFSDLKLVRNGGGLDGKWLWRARGVKWTRDSSSTRATSQAGRIIEDAVWRAISRIDSVEIEADFRGELTKPALGIKTNIANVISNALRDQLGDEVRKAEAQVRAKVDELVESKVAEARAQADVVKREAEQRVAGERAKLAEQKTALEAKLRELVRIPGIGGA